MISWSKLDLLTRLSKEESTVSMLLEHSQSSRPFTAGSSGSKPGSRC